MPTPLLLMGLATLIQEYDLKYLCMNISTSISVCNRITGIIGVTLILCWHSFSNLCFCGITDTSLSCCMNMPWQPFSYNISTECRPHKAAAAKAAYSHLYLFSFKISFSFLDKMFAMDSASRINQQC